MLSSESLNFRSLAFIKRLTSRALFAVHQSGELEQLLQGAGLVDTPPKASAETGTGP